MVGTQRVGLKSTDGLEANAPFDWQERRAARCPGFVQKILANRVAYRVYFGKDGDALIILLGGGTKKRQQRDIEAAKSLWKQYKQRKRQES